MSVKKQPEARQGWETDVPKLALQLKSPFVKPQLPAYLCCGIGIRVNSPAVPEIML